MASQETTSPQQQQTAANINPMDINSSGTRAKSDLWSGLKQRTISAAWGASMTSLLMTPLDVVKVKMQAASRLQKGKSTISGKTLEGIWKIARTEGPLELWRGLGPTMAMAVPNTVAYFVAYESMKDLLQNDTFGPQISTYSPMISGSVARIVAVSLISPIELLRTQMQVHSRPLPQALMALHRTVKDGAGISALYRGLQPTLWRDVPFSALYWTLYEKLSKPILSSILIRNYQEEVDWLSSSVSFLAGGLSGAVSAAVTTPFDVAKTQRQMDFLHGNRPLSVWTHLHDIYNSQGIKGLFRGIIPRVGKVAPACAIMIGSYEFGKRHF